MLCAVYGEANWTKVIRVRVRGVRGCSHSLVSIHICVRNPLHCNGSGFSSLFVYPQPAFSLSLSLVCPPTTFGILLCHEYVHRVTSYPRNKPRTRTSLELAYPRGSGCISTVYTGLRGYNVHILEDTDVEFASPCKIRKLRNALVWSLLSASGPHTILTTDEPWRFVATTKIRQTVLPPPSPVSVTSLCLHERLKQYSI